MNLIYQVTEGVIVVDETENSVTLEAGSDFFLGHGTTEQLRHIAMAYMSQDNRPDLWYQVQAWPRRTRYVWAQSGGDVSWILPQPIDCNV